MTGLRKTNFIYGAKRRGRPSKALKRIVDLYKQSKCRDCSVQITRMDFKKMLGKFTKVKIQYENKDDENIENDISKFFNSELRYRGNGTVSIHESLYYQHPLIDIFKQIQNSSEKVDEPEMNVLQNNNSVNQIKPYYNSVYKDNNKNRYKKIYGLLFDNPEVVDNLQNGEPDFTFVDLLLEVKKNTVMPPEWIVDFLPKTETLPKKDHLYDRIAAELEDLMSTDTPQTVSLPQIEEAKPSDEFPSIMDILNEQPVTQENEKTEYEGDKSDIEMIVSNTENTSRKNSIDPSDIEAMLADNDDAKKSEKPEIDGVSSDMKEHNLTQTSGDKLPESDLPVNKENKPVEKSEVSNLIDIPVEKSEVINLTDIPVEESDELKLDDNETDVKETDDTATTPSVKYDLEDKSIEEKEATEKTRNDDKDVQISEVSESEKTDEVVKPNNKDKKQKENNDSVKSEQSVLDATEDIEKSKIEIKVKEVEIEKDREIVVKEEDSLQKDEIPMEIEQEQENKQNNNVDSINNNVDPVDTLQQESNDDTKDVKPDISIDNIVTVNNNINVDSVTHIVFKKTATEKFVKCDKSLSYTIQIHGKDVELLGAPKFISSIEDLQVLLQIVNDTELNSFNILH